MIGCGLLDGGEGHAGFGGKRRVFGVHRAHAVHSGEREDDGVAVGIGSRPPALTGVAALGNDRHVQVRAGTHDGGDFPGAARTHDSHRAAMIAATPVGDIRSDVACVGEDLRAAYGRVEPRPQGCAKVSHEPR